VSPMACAEVEALAAELALGTVSGAERAGALDHLAGCPACRELVDQLARAADSLLLLAPVVEPPPGFESKVLARMGVAPVVELRRPRRRRLLVGVAAVALVAAMSGAGVARLATEDRRGTGIRTVLIADDEGQWTCRAMVYGEKPAWLVISLDRADGSNNSYSVEAMHAGGAEPVPLGTFSLQGGHGTFAKPLELPADDLQSVRVLDAGGRVRYTMVFEDARRS
jgi:hypothetical protein